MSNIHISTITSTKNFVNFLESINSISDKRLNRRKKHALVDIAVIIILSMLGGENDISSIARFGVRHQEELELVLDLPHGIPSRSTFSRVLASINPHELSSWVNYCQNAASKSCSCSHIAFDGKKDRANGIMHLRAFDSQNCRVVAHESVAEARSEITAVPGLLEKVDLTKRVATADAMHAQKRNAKQIIDKEGDYVLTLKGNQRQLHEDVKFFFDDIEENGDQEKVCNRFETFEKSRNRIERRICLSTGYVGWIYRGNQWKKLKSISVIISSRTIGKRTTTQRRYFISSLEPDAERILTLARSHWEIENQCHRALDIEFDSDRSTIQNRTTALNFSILKDFALFILKRGSPEVPLKEKRSANNHRIELALKSLIGIRF